MINHQTRLFQLYMLVRELSKLHTLMYKYMKINEMRNT